MLSRCIPFFLSIKAPQQRRGLKRLLKNLDPIKTGFALAVTGWAGFWALALAGAEHSLILGMAIVFYTGLVFPAWKNPRRSVRSLRRHSASSNLPYQKEKSHEGH